MRIVEAAGMVCQDMGNATAAKGLQSDYGFMYQDAWSFEYGDELKFHSLNPKEYDIFYQLSQSEQEKLVETYNQQLGRKVSVGDCKCEEYLKTFHGIEVLHKKYGNKKEYWESILEQLERGYPVEMWFDQYFMPWTKEVRKKAPLRYQGYMMINGYDKEKQLIHCIDIHGTRKQEEMPLSFFKEFLQEHKNYSYTTYNRTEPTERFDTENFIHRSLQRVYGNRGNSMFDEMRRLGNDIENNFDFQKEIDLSIAAKGMLAAPTHVMCAKSFTEVSRMRNLFALTLEYIAEQNQDDIFLNVSKRMKLHATKWQMLVSLMGKAYYKKNFTELKIQIAEHIMRIADEEEETVEVLERCLSKDQTKSEMSGSAAGTNEKKDRFVFCKLEMNNKAFASNSGNEAGADFDGLGNYLLINPQLKGAIQDSKLFLGDKVFVFMGMTQGMDNVCCLGQKVKVQTDNYRGLSILGACDSGAFFGKLEFIFEDGSSEESIFGFGEWRFGKCEFGETLAWSGDRVYWNQVNQEEKGYLFTNELAVKAEKKLSAIRLPECGNMHIFAITLFS